MQHYNFKQTDFYILGFSDYQGVLIGSVSNNSEAIVTAQTALLVLPVLCAGGGGGWAR